MSYFLTLVAPEACDTWPAVTEAPACGFSVARAMIESQTNGNFNRK